MSFLNPVSLPVRRFSSTDTDAPQIDYANRVAGDVKTVLKACLVTGYGDTASAGWTIQNETDFGAEFVSPDTAMSDYRLCVDDTSASSTQWYYQYNDARTNPTNSNVNKNINYVDKASDQNGWEVLVTLWGVLLIEKLLHAYVPQIVARITYFGRTKSALASDDKNIAYLNIGLNSSISSLGYYFNRDKFVYYINNDVQNLMMTSANSAFLSSGSINSSAVVDMISPLFVCNNESLIAQHPALLLNAISADASPLGVYETTVAGRPMLHICVASASRSASELVGEARVFLAYLDNWDY